MIRAASVLAILALATPALAQEREADEPTDTAELEARALFEAGEGAVGERRFGDALRLFERSLELHPTAAAAFNAAIAAQEMGEHVVAAQHLDRLLQGRYGELPAARAASVRQLRETTVERLGTLELSSEDPYVEVVIDGRSVPSTGTHYLAPGRHALVVRRPGRAPRERELQLAAGERRSLDLLLEVEVEDAVGEGAEPPDDRDPGSGDPTPSDDPDVGLIVGLTIGAVLVVGAGVGIGVGVAQSQSLPGEFIGSAQTLAAW